MIDVDEVITQLNQICTQADPNFAYYAQLGKIN